MRLSYATCKVLWHEGSVRDREGSIEDRSGRSQDRSATSDLVLMGSCDAVQQTFKVHKANVSETSGFWQVSGSRFALESLLVMGSPVDAAASTVQQYCCQHIASQGKSFVAHCKRAYTNKLSSVT
jgi:hypothetical protein